MIRYDYVLESVESRPSHHVLDSTREDQNALL